jgi:hypothetical protein
MQKFALRRPRRDALPWSALAADLIPTARRLLQPPPAGLREAH